MDIFFANSQTDSGMDAVLLFPPLVFPSKKSLQHLPPLRTRSQPSVFDQCNFSLLHFPPPLSMGNIAMFTFPPKNRIFFCLFTVCLGWFGWVVCERQEGVDLAPHHFADYSPGLPFGSLKLDLDTRCRKGDEVTEVLALYFKRPLLFRLPPPHENG